MAEMLLKSAGFSEWYLDFLSEVSEAINKDYLIHSIIRCEKITGRELFPSVQFAKDHVNAFQKSGEKPLR